MIFDVYQDGKPTFRAMAIDEKVVLNLVTLEKIEGIDFENEAGDILIYDIFDA